MGCCCSALVQEELRNAAVNSCDKNICKKKINAEICCVLTGSLASDSSIQAIPSSSSTKRFLLSLKTALTPPAMISFSRFTVGLVALASSNCRSCGTPELNRAEQQSKLGYKKCLYHILYCQFWSLNWVSWDLPHYVCAPSHEMPEELIASKWDSLVLHGVVVSLRSPTIRSTSPRRGANTVAQRRSYLAHRILFRFATLWNNAHIEGSKAASTTLLLKVRAHLAENGTEPTAVAQGEPGEDYRIWSIEHLFLVWKTPVFGCVGLKSAI